MKSLPFRLILILFIFAFLLFSYLKFINPNKLFPQYPLPAPTDWQTYSPPEYEITFRYPEYFRLNGSVELLPKTESGSPAADYLVIKRKTSQNINRQILGFKPGQSETITRMLTSQGGTSVIRYTRQEDIKVGSIKSAVFKLEDKIDRTPKYEIYIPRRFYFYVIDIKGQKYLDQYAQILSSLRFIDTNNMGHLSVHINGGSRKESCEPIQIKPCYPYNNKDIEIVDQNGNIFTTVKTDASGMFSITLPVGEYRFIKAPGTPGQMESVTFSIYPGETASLGASVKYLEIPAFNPAPKPIDPDSEALMRQFTDAEFSNGINWSDKFIWSILNSDDPPGWWISGTGQLHNPDGISKLGWKLINSSETPPGFSGKSSTREYSMDYNGRKRILYFTTVTDSPCTTCPNLSLFINDPLTPLTHPTPGDF